MKFAWTFILIALSVSCSSENSEVINEDSAQPVYAELYDPVHGHVTTIDDVDSVVNMLRADSIVRDRHVGFTGAQCETYAYFIRLKELADDTTLLTLLEDPDPVIRVYAYWALIDHNYPKSQALLALARNDSTYVPYMSGCIVMQEPVASIVDQKWQGTHPAVK